MKDVLKVIVFLVLAVPFIYMAYDVLKDLLSSVSRLVKTKGRLAWLSVTSFLTD